MKNEHHRFKERRRNINKWLSQYLHDKYKEGRSTSKEFVHTFKRHGLHMTDDELMKRASSEKCDASAFTISDEDVVKIIHDYLLGDSYNEVLDYLADKEDDSAWLIAGKFNSSIGKIYLYGKDHNWSDGAIECNAICIIIDKDISGTGNNLYVKTAYPYNSNYRIPIYKDYV